MGDAYQIKDQYALHFLTFQVVGWIDIFSRQSYRDVVVNSFNFCRKEKQLEIHAWVIMSNHVHCILSSGNGRLSETIGELKGFTAREMLKMAETGNESPIARSVHLEQSVSLCSIMSVASRYSIIFA